MSVRHAVQEALGAKVERAMRVWGGYGPTPTYRLRLADGRRAFFKAVSPDSNEFMRAAYSRERRVYEQLGDLIAGWAPSFYGAFERDGWSVILLEDLGPKSVPSWTPSLARRITHAYGRFHVSTRGADLPSWLPRIDQLFGREGWLWQWAERPEGLQSLADLAGDQAEEARRWLDAALPALKSTSRCIAEAAPPHAFLHGDTRSDNLRWVRGRLYLLDWPHVSIGPAECDAAAFAQSVTVEGGPEPEQVMAWYAETSPVRQDVLDGAVASLASFFAGQAWLPDIPDLPRLRGFQRRQLRITLAWAARRLHLPEPTWLCAVSETPSRLP